MSVVRRLPPGGRPVDEAAVDEQVVDAVRPRWGTR